GGETHRRDVPGSRRPGPVGPREAAAHDGVPRRGLFGALPALRQGAAARAADPRADAARGGEGGAGEADVRSRAGLGGRDRGLVAGAGAGSGQAASRPLAGLRVLEIGQIAAGPFAGMLLADLGADVVKV